MSDGWTWTAINEDDGASLGTITLPDMGLAPLDTLVLSAEFLSELAQRTLGLPLVYISEGHARVWVVKDTGANPLGSVSLVDLRLLPTELAALDQATLHDKICAQLGVPADNVVEEIVPDDLRLWIAADERGALLGMATVATLGITPEERAPATSRRCTAASVRH